MNTFSLSSDEIEDINTRLGAWGRKKLGRTHPRPKGIKRVLLAMLKGLIFFHVFYIGWIFCLCAIFSFTMPGVTGFMIYRGAQNIGKAKPVQMRPIQPVPFKQIPKRVRNAFILLEDHEFYQHNGISLGAMREAMERNIHYKRLVFGGSTISQQAAKNLFLYPDRTFVRKYLEIIATLVMETALSKDRILELYLNTIEFGPGVFGLGTAAKYHYGTAFSKLSLDQGYRLAVIITSPLRFSPKTFYKNAGMMARYQALTN